VTPESAENPLTVITETVNNKKIANIIRMTQSKMNYVSISKRQVWTLLVPTSMWRDMHKVPFKLVDSMTTTVATRHSSRVPGWQLEWPRGTLRVALTECTTYFILMNPWFLLCQFNDTKHYKLFKILTVFMANLISHLFPARVGIKRSPMFSRRRPWAMSEICVWNYNTDISISHSPVIWEKLRSS
jgi:hypothetical protein